MTDEDRRSIARAVLGCCGRTFSEELGIRIERNTPSPLFRLLCFALLSSARIGHELALRAARALVDHGWTTPRKMADATWARRTRVLNRAGYARYDESTSRMLGESCELLLERYRGDLRRLRDEAERKPEAERRLLKEFKGIGDVGVDIFFREAQATWKELYPFVDRRAKEAADRLGLGRDAGQLKVLTGGPGEFTRLVAGLVRVDLQKRYDEVRERAA